MSIRYVLKRLGAFFATVLFAITINFVVPRLAPQDPIAALLNQLNSRRGTVAGAEQLIEAYRARLGLDDSLVIQYLRYLRNLVFEGELGYSIAYFPNQASDLILRAIPWSILLLGSAFILAFILGNLAGALAAWPRSPKVLKGSVYLLMPLSIVPYYFLALILVHVFAVQLQVFPLGGVLTAGSARGMDVETLFDLVRHMFLPVMSIVLALVGFWALSMRGSMSTVLNQPHIAYAEAKGLRSRRILLRYAIRPALLPQWTALALDFGTIISGALIAEIIFSYPGVGTVLFNALRTADYFVIQGVVLFIIVGVSLATLVVDLVNPILDPRIRYS